MKPPKIGNSTVLPKEISIEIVYAGETTQTIHPLRVTEGCTILQAIQDSKILSLYPEIGSIDSLKESVGIFGKLKNFSQVLRDGDRVEIYRVLFQEPMEARRNRAKLEVKKPRPSQPKRAKRPKKNWREGS